MAGRQNARRRDGGTGPGRDGPVERRRGLVMVSDTELLDALLRMAAAAGCELVRAVDPTQARRHWTRGPSGAARSAGRPYVRRERAPPPPERDRRGARCATADGVGAGGRGGRRERGVAARGRTVAGGGPGGGGRGRTGRRRRPRRGRRPWGRGGVGVGGRRGGHGGARWRARPARRLRPPRRRPGPRARRRGPRRTALARPRCRRRSRAVHGPARRAAHPGRRRCRRAGRAVVRPDGARTVPDGGHLRARVGPTGR